MLDAGIAKEIARSHLPISIYTEWYWKIDLHNFFHFIGLRADKHAQEEIRVYADAMVNLIRPAFPIACAAFDDYHPFRGGMLLSRMEVEALRALIDQSAVYGLKIDTDSEREQNEWRAKAERLGLIVPA